ncbi:hypothetical protein COY28_01045 [Candidatus Woesearchaeota archaeon CG_4_10_14_0_2_um_filter_57_5]|nr:MAG: hypothetical protein AUJ68_03150 [Candidatus Woesearchaeota archaeon CG1_02_57_44]PIN68243.1 MAG: hypothetical protein COV94_05760 [Candidatus Woesearchaeota archaeon CG11_big_fil_rev_8_21_14_0_20_57_5]PIZ56339.1 MAG: hypothetical protein COY28_01045 [Candidatus Woesearchaeota archaeon CG_4_10_14_0_2_um_filter_57_5]
MGQGKRGQVSMEYLFVAGLAFILVLPLTMVTVWESRNINTDVAITQTDRIGEELINSVQTVYYHGYPSTRTIRLYFPQYLSDITFDEHRIVFTITATGHDLIVIREAVTNLTGSLSSTAGIHTITLSAQSNNTVSITE